jgi:hypothetical protein
VKNGVHYKDLCIVAAVVILIMLGGLLAFTLVSLNASNKLLYRLRLPKPGTNIESVMGQLGRPMYDGTSDRDEMMHRGSIKDPAFLQDKKLFWFYVSTPPCRVMEVYTDTNNIIVFVTWQQL